MRIKLDRTVCDGFGPCAAHAPETFVLDDWGYASLADGASVPPERVDGVRRALLDCPVHAIVELPDLDPPVGRDNPGHGPAS
jgi:ferredoxin